MEQHGKSATGVIEAFFVAVFIALVVWGILEACGW